MPYWLTAARTTLKETDDIFINKTDVTNVCVVLFRWGKFQTSSSPRIVLEANPRAKPFCRTAASTISLVQGRTRKRHSARGEGRGAHLRAFAACLGFGSAYRLSLSMSEANRRAVPICKHAAMTTWWSPCSRFVVYSSAPPFWRTAASEMLLSACKSLDAYLQSISVV